MSKFNYVLIDLAANDSRPLFSQQEPQQMPMQQPSNGQETLADLQSHNADQGVHASASDANSRDLFQAMEPNFQYRTNNKVPTRSKL